MTQATIQNDEIMLDEYLREISVLEFQEHPERIAEFFNDNSDITVILKQEGDKIRIYTQSYSDEVNQAFQELEADYQHKKKEGYTKEQAFDDLTKAQENIAKSLQ